MSSAPIANGVQEGNSANVTWSFARSPEMWRSSQLIAAWEGLLAESNNPKVLYQTPEWLGHLHSVESNKRLAVAVGRDSMGG
jgi:hypothetical protein